MITKIDAYQVGDGPTFATLDEALGYEAFKNINLIHSILHNRVKTHNAKGESAAALTALEDGDFREAVRSLKNFLDNFPSVKAKSKPNPKP
jgi:TolA-binding protein